MKRSCSGIYLTLLMVFTVFFIANCSNSVSDTPVSSGGSGTTAAVTAASLSLSLTQASVLSDNSDSSTVTATVLDSSLAPVPSTTVAFSASAGIISASSVQTDASGQASTAFSSGTAERANQVVTITATVAGLAPRQIPIQITGTTVTLTSGGSGVGLDVNPLNPALASGTLTIAVRDAANIGIYDAPVTVSIDPASTGTALLASGAVSNVTTLTADTDVSGELDVVVTGTGAGSVIVNVASQGATASITYTVTASASAFSIQSPTANPSSLATNTDLNIIVNAPSQATVLFSSTFGSWDGGASSAVTKVVAAGIASAVLRATSSGVATVQVSDPSAPATLDTLTVAVSAPTSEASQIALQANTTVVAPSSGGVTHTATLTATVKNSSDQVVGNAPVIFSLQNTTGGGETISPAVAYTTSSGVATATFSSGTLSSSAQGVTVTAIVLDTAITDSISIVIGGTAGSLVIGQATTVSSIYNNTAYQLAMTVMVTDSNGNAVGNTDVSLKLWPTRYAAIPAFWLKSGDTYIPIYSEDVNQNGVLDAAEDLNANGVIDTTIYANEDTNENLILDGVEDLNGDGLLTPPSSAAGTLPSTITTDENGAAEFNLIYLKDSAAWIEAEITASTEVLGSEAQSVVTFFLGYAKSDADAGLLGDSLYLSP